MIDRVLDPNGPAQVAPGFCALAVMTKAPRAGKVKTRLTPPLTAEEAATLNTCFLRDLTAVVAAAAMESRARGIAVYTPVGAEGAYEGILPSGFQLVSQRGNAFGERLTFAAEDLFRLGFQAVCLINSDSPTVPASSFAEAANELAKPGDRVVLGPSDDGGYYLIGMKKLHRRLFEAIDWSTERVFDQTTKRAAKIGIKVHSLPRGFDVDDRATLQRLCDELVDTTTDIAPATRDFLSEIIAREGRARIWPEGNATK